MPRLDGNMQSLSIAGRGGFAFTGTRIEKLGATDYTLVTIAVDETGSVYGFDDQLLNMAIAAVDACKKNPRSDNILVRLIRFSTVYNNGVDEIHGFKPLADIDTASYPKLKPGGDTPLCDACYSAIGATNMYGKQLRDQDYGVNAIIFVITDGGENRSSATRKMVKEEQQKSISGETLESCVSVLIGINTAYCGTELQHFQQEAGMTQYIDAGDVTPRKLAKLAEFVSRSVSSQSQALGTGGASQNIAATI
jgi:uncharacterized protein YegL